MGRQLPPECDRPTVDLDRLFGYRGRRGQQRRRVMPTSVLWQLREHWLSSHQAAEFEARLWPRAAARSRFRQGESAWHRASSSRRVQQRGLRFRSHRLLTRPLWSGRCLLDVAAELVDFGHLCPVAQGNAAEVVEVRDRSG